MMLAAVLALWRGLGVVCPDYYYVVSNALRNLHNTLAGLWMAGRAPLVFVHLGLGEKPNLPH